MAQPASPVRRSRWSERWWLAAALALAGLLGLLFAQPGPVAGAAPGLALRDDLEWQMLDALNGERAARGLAPLQRDVGTSDVARDRSWDMAERNYFAHVSPEGVTAFGMLDQRGIPYWAAAENLAMNNYADGQTVEVAVNGFVNSPGHAANLFNARYNWVGIGAVTRGDMKYFAVVFISAD